MTEIINEEKYPNRPTFGIKVLLIDDQEFIAQAVRKMLEGESDIQFYSCKDPAKAMETANRVHPTVILQDLVMPEVDGLVLVRYFRANAETENIPLIVLSVKEEPKIKAEAFALGANDYLVKLPDKVELVARIRYHSYAYIRLLERNEAYEKLAESQKNLEVELQEAAAYVASLLPEPILEGPVQAQWKFIPSTKLGGDAFGYHWIDPEHFCMYLLDVCGHGVGAAVYSISIMTVLKANSLPETDFHSPKEVLTSLNERFPMEMHNNMFFTIWYGVFDTRNRKLTYSSAGHPPAILFLGKNEKTTFLSDLATPGFVIGGLSKSNYINKSVSIENGGKLYLFSDGVYEISGTDGTLYTFDHFKEILIDQPAKLKAGTLDHLVEVARKWNGPHPFADDFSIIEFTLS